MSVSVQWHGLDEMADQFGQWHDRAESNITAEMTDIADDWTLMMMYDHPWTNRTGDAEGGLHVDVSHGGGGWTMEAGHGVYYGIYLEKKHGGKWGVLLPTMMKIIPTVQDRIIKALFAR